MLKDATVEHGDWVALSKQAAAYYWKHRQGVDWDDRCNPADVTVYASNMDKDETYGEALVGGCFKPAPFLVIYPDTEKASWPYFCSIVIHELGHLLGKEHSTDPRDVMYPYITRANLQTSICQRFAPMPGTRPEIPSTSGSR